MAVLFIIPSFLNPNIHYSLFISPRYPSLIIQLPPRTLLWSERVQSSVNCTTRNHNPFGSMGLNAERYVRNRGEGTCIIVIKPPSRSFVVKPPSHAYAARTERSHVLAAPANF